EAVGFNDDKLPDFSVPHGRQHWHHQVRLNGPLYAMMIEDKCVEAGVNLRFYETPVEVVQHKEGWKVTTIGKGTKTEIVCNQLIDRSEEHTSELQSRENLVCRLLLEKKKKGHQ